MTFSRRNHGMTRHLTLLAALLLLLAIGPRPALAHEASSSPVTAERLASSGWTPASGPFPSGEMPLVNPAVPVAEAVRILHFRPESFPRPFGDAGDRSVALPVPPRAEYTHRVEDPVPSLTWAIDAVVAQAGEGFTWAQVDVPPLEPKRTSATGKAKRRHTLDATAEVERPLDHATPPAGGWHQDPRRRTGPSPEAMAPDERTWPTISVVPVADIDRDGLFVTPDEGRTWLRVELSASTLKERSHALEGWSLHGAAAGGERALLAAPRVKRMRGRVVLVAVSESGAVRDLGSPAIRGASWRQEVTDARFAADGAVEAVVVVREPTPSTEEPADSWGAVMRRDTAGSWVELKRFALPGSDPRMEVRLGQGEILLGLDDLVGRQPL